MVVQEVSTRLPLCHASFQERRERVHGNSKIGGMSTLTGAQGDMIIPIAAPALLTAVVQNPDDCCSRSLPLILDLDVGFANEQLNVGP